MKKLLRITSSVILASLFSSSCSNIQFTKVTPQSKITQSHYLTLPKTIVEVKVPVKTITYKKAKNFISDLSKGDLLILESYFGFNKDIYEDLKTKNVIRKYKIDKPEINYGAEIDDSKVFAVKLSRFLKKQDFSINYSETGLVSKFEATNQSLVDDYLIKTISAAGTIIGAAKGGIIPKATIFKNKNLSKLKDLHDDLKKLKDIYDFEVYKDQKTKIEDEIKSIINKYLYGINSVTNELKIVYSPAKGTDVNDSQIILFNINDKDGSVMLNKSIEKQLDIYYLGKINPSSDLSVKKNSYYVKFKDKELPMYKLINDNIPSKLGYPFNVPKTCRFEFGKITDDNGASIIQKVEKIKVSQFGFVAYLDRNLSKAQIEYNELTGEIKSVVSTSGEDFSESISSISDSSKGLIESLDSESELDKLRKEAEVLELKKKILELKQTNN